MMGAAAAGWYVVGVLAVALLLVSVAYFKAARQRDHLRDLLARDQ